MEMAQIGATPRGGCNRQALTDEDRRGRDLFVQWCKAAGCGIKVDEMGNIFARRAGTDESLPPVIAGSHLDTQPTGGKFDGVYGVLAGLEVMRTLQDAGVETRSPLEVVVWTNEEGARFVPAMVGSGRNPAAKAPSSMSTLSERSRAIASVSSGVSRVSSCSLPIA